MKANRPSLLHRGVKHQVLQAGSVAAGVQPNPSDLPVGFDLAAEPRPPFLVIDD